MKLIEICHSSCVGCRLCEMICSLFHEGECSTTRSRIRISRDEEFGNNLVSLCIQCADACCVESCPSSALSRDPETGVVLVDGELCTGCEACIDACPLGAISYDKERKTVFKCDLCGGDPECVKFCSRGALVLKDSDIDSPERRSFMMETGNLLSQR
jgi:anaerobic carbon-monoxide dehydrogenase iron sulfur subunit